MLDYHSIPTVASTIESDVGGDLTSFEDGSWKGNLSLCPAVLAACAMGLLLGALCGFITGIAFYEAVSVTLLQASCTPLSNACTCTVNMVPPAIATRFSLTQYNLTHHGHQGTNFK